MSTTALIVEYNPFHNGHQYHINKSKEITESDNLIVIMSGNFSQRGNPTILDKWARTEQALSSGADLVLELPLAFNIRSAEYFAHYSILSLEKTNIVDSIVFGSEAGNINILTDIADSLINENDIFKNHLNKFLKEGFNFPTARYKALLKAQSTYPKLNKYNKNTLKKVLASPNNILGIEYLKSLLKINSKINAQTIKRIGTEYHSNQINKKYASASLIRKIINSRPKRDALKKVKNLMPKRAWEILKKELKLGRFVKKSREKDIFKKLIDQLRRFNSKDLLEYKGLKNGLENRIIKTARSNIKAENFIETLLAKHLTESKIKRKLLQIYFKLNKSKLNLLENQGVSYLRILGVKKGKENLISQLKEESNLEIIINPSEKIRDINLNSSNPLELSLSYDLLASDLYSLLYQNAQFSKSQRDFYQKLIKV